MNISTSSTDTSRIQQPTETPAAATVEKTSASSKTEESKDDKVSEQKGEFKKVLEERQSTDKVSVEQQMQLQNQNQNQNGQVNENYANKFGFDTVSKFRNLQCSMNYDTVKISQDDAKFFADLVDNKQFAIQQNGDKANLIKFADEIGPTYRMQQTSGVLTNLISKAYNEQKPVRIDFDNNVSVILKVDSKGKVTAEFIPGDKAVEAYLRNNIGFLKQRFDDQNISYNDLFYRQSNQNHNNNREKRQNQQQDKGE